MIQFAKNVRMQLLLIITLCLATPMLAATMDGFVTKVDSPTAFDIGSLHVVMNGKTQCETQTLDADIQLKSHAHDDFLAVGVPNRSYFSLQNHLNPSSILPAFCNGLSLKVGDQVQIIGDAGHGDGSFFAAQVVMYIVQIRQVIVCEGMYDKWQSGALLEENPQVSRTAQGWAGTVWLDGYPMRVTPNTRLLTASSTTVMGYDQFSTFGIHPHLFPYCGNIFNSFSIATSTPSPRMGALQQSQGSPKFSANLWQPDTWATYRGVGRVDGRVQLKRIRLWPNHVDTREKKFWTHLTPVLQSPDYQNRISGTVKFPHMRDGKILKILPDEKVQDFVSKLGMTLIPLYQKALPETDATKIHFRFYVVQPAGATLDEEMRKIDGSRGLIQSSWNETAAALPNGKIFISDRALASIGNEAQLASILSSSITSVLQKQSYIVNKAFLGTFGNIFGSNDAQLYFFRKLVLGISTHEQALRIGIRQMYLAGYDIREAPYAWAVAQGKSVNNPVIDSAHPDQEIPWYAAYAFNYISHYYQDVDYSKLKRGQREYQQFLQELYKADPSLPRPASSPTQIPPQAQTQPATH